VSGLMSLAQTPTKAQAELAGTAVIDGREWFQVTFSCNGDGVIAVDREGRVSYLNPAAEKLTDWQ
jgi:PAS domain-containing protein